ncbi:unnamed protein product, partial [marine sediment metagenome]
SNNAVGYFVSYYDFYQPEAYMPKTDTYIEKEVTINDEIDRLRLAATTALMQRPDTVIVASVSCIYGLGSPEDYRRMLLYLRTGEAISRAEILRRLVDMQYTRNDVDFCRGTFRVRGDVIDIFPAYGQSPLRVELFGDDVDRIDELHPVTGETRRRLQEVHIYAAKHFVTPQHRVKQAIASIREELAERLA